MSAETKWTPGPWVYRRLGVIVSEGVSIELPKGVVHPQIFLALHLADRPEHEQDANGTLAAAAPELAEALTMALRELRCCRDQLAAHGIPSREGGSVNTAIEMGAAVLAKAGA